MRHLFFALAIAAAFTSQAKSITIADAKTVAFRIYQERSNEQVQPEEFILTHVFAVKQLPLLYVFNRGENQGFVLVSATDQAFPIPGYSFTGHYNMESKNPAFEDWTKNYAEQIAYIISENLPATTMITENWNRLLGRGQTQPVNVQAVGPLLTTTWNQTCYYNEQTPTGTSACGHQYTGCGATALAQMMRYHNFPATGTGSHSYTWNSITHNVNFGATTYNWSNMPNSVSASNSDVAQLMYHSGVALDMQYGNSVSNCFFNFNSIMPQYFGYAPTITNWLTLLISNDTTYQTRIAAEHDSLRPVFYKGNGSNGQHFFICDGYQNAGYPYHFHFNWGWGGLYNGYFYTSALNPGSYSFTSGQGAAIRVMPPSLTLDITNVETSAIRLFPNPAENEFTLGLNGTENDISIFDTKGSLVFTSHTAEKQIQVNTSQFPQGIYVIQLTDKSGQRSVKKLIVQRN